MAGFSNALKDFLGPVEYQQTISAKIQDTPSALCRSVPYYFGKALVLGLYPTINFQSIRTCPYMDRS